MIVVADASPLIFLAKLKQLKLISTLLGKDVRLPKDVMQEVLHPDCDPAERQELETFLTSCSVEKVSRPRQFAAAMSRADNAALTLALRNKAGILLCDERITRRMAEIERVQTLGTLGVLLRARREGVIPAEEARRLVDQLIRQHNFRISVEVYQAVLAELGM